MKVNGNLHRDIDKHERAIECIVELIACVLLVDLIEDVHLLVTIHRRGQSQVVPSYEDVQLSLCMEDTNQSPEKEKIPNH